MDFPQIFSDDTDVIYVKDKSTAFIISFNPITRPQPGEESWPIDNIDKVESKDDVMIDLGIEGETKNAKPEDIKRYGGIIEKYGESYSRRNDYERVLGKSNTQV